MNPRYTAHEYSRLLDAAKARANALREQAMQDLWNETGDALRTASRAANRLAHSLARHLRLRERQHARTMPLGAHGSRLPLV